MHLGKLILLLFFSLSLARSQVLFPDPRLETAVRQALHIFSGPITTNDMEGLTLLSDNVNPNNPNNGFGIRDLTGLETAVNLKYLFLYRSPLTNVAALSALSRLVMLELSLTSVSNLAFLSAMPELQYLSAGGNQIQDVSPLAGHPSLQNCSLAGNPITNVQALSNLPQLSLLNMQAVPMSSLDFLTNLPALYSFQFGPSSIADFSTLTNTSIRALEIYQGSATNWSVLGNMPLDFLTVDHPVTPFDDLGFCASLDLRGFTLRGTAVTNLAPLAASPFLSTLELSDLPISDFTVLATLTNLEQVTITNTGLRDLNWLNGLPQVFRLNVSANSITNWAPLPTSVWDLNISSTGISNLSVLSGLSNLAILYAASNAIADLTPLSGLTNLRHGDFSANCISNLAPLVSLPLFNSASLNDNCIDMNTGSPGRTSLNQLLAKPASVTYFRQRYQPRLSMSATATNGGFELILRFSTCPRVRHAIERSTDFITWTYVGTVDGGFNFSLYPDPLTVRLGEIQPPGNFFYRLRVSYY